MNQKQLILILVVGAIIGAAGFGLWKKDKAGWVENTRSREKLIANFPGNDVAQITIKASTNELNLAKKEDRWIVKERSEFPANFSEIADLVRKLEDMKPGDSIDIGQSNLGRLGLLEPGKGTNAATKVEFKDKAGKTLSTLMLGKNHMKKAPANSPYGGGGEWPDGRYVMVGNDIKTVCLVKETFSNVEPKPESWLDKDFIKIEKIKSIAVTYPEATNTWKISRETESGEWKLAEPLKDEQLDSTKASSAGSSMMNPSFNDVVSRDAKPEETGLDKPLTAKIETFDGFSYTLKFGKKTSDDNGYNTSFVVEFAPAKERVPGKDEKAEDKEKLDKEFKDAQAKLSEKFKKEQALEKWNYILSKWSVESILKPRSEMMAKKEEPPKPDDKKE